MHGSQCLRQGGLPGLAGSGASAVVSLLKDCNAKPTLKVIIGTQARIQDPRPALPDTQTAPGSPLNLSPS